MAMQDLLPKEVLKEEKRFSWGNVLFKSIEDEKRHIQPVYNSKDKCPKSLEISTVVVFKSFKHLSTIIEIFIKRKEFYQV